MNPESAQQAISGVWLPIVTPFLYGQVDLESYERLVGYYLNQGISGLIPLGTTGEGPTVELHEVEALIDLTIELVDRRIPVYIGIGGNSTQKVIQTLQRLERFAFDGILSVCPYYNRPSEEGICQHFRNIASATDRSIIIYNIPYRTGVNLSNDSVLELAEIPNIVGIKDSCGNLLQSSDLLRRRPPNFSVMTGEDAMFYATLTLGGDGGILASAHFQPRKFVEVYRLSTTNNHHSARALWDTLEPATRLLFKEPNPMPLKQYLYQHQAITTPDCRLPLTRTSSGLSRELTGLPGLS